MKIARKKGLSPKKKLLIIIAAVAVIGAAAAAFYFFGVQHNSNTAADQPRPVNTVDYSAPTEQQTQDTSNQKDQIIKDYTDDQNSSGDDNGTSTPSSDITVTISRANQTSAGLSIGTVISGTQSGTCTVTLTKSGQSTVQKTFDITFEATNAFCKEALIPIGDIPASGEWQLNVTATNGSSSSKTATQNVTIDKP